MEELCLRYRFILSILRVFACYENHFVKNAHAVIGEEVNANDSRILPLPNPRQKNKLYPPVIPWIHLLGCVLLIIFKSTFN